VTSLESWTSRARSVAVAVVGLCLAAGCVARPDLDADADELRSLHERVLAAHRSGDVGDWMAVEAEEYVSANGGTITLPSVAERLAAREPYLRSTTFTSYRDLRPPIVALSRDRTLGWLIAEVEIRGTQISEGAENGVDAIWAWVELYEKQDGVWRLVGNVSNRRP